jgi:hypothetical protein
MIIGKCTDPLMDMVVSGVEFSVIKYRLRHIAIDKEAWSTRVLRALHHNQYSRPMIPLPFV